MNAAQPSGLGRQLVKQRAIHLVPHTHAKHTRAGRPFADQPQQFGLFTLLRHAVRQYDNIELPVGIVVAIGGFDGGGQNCAAHRLLRTEKL